VQLDEVEVLCELLLEDERVDETFLRRRHVRDELIVFKLFVLGLVRLEDVLTNFLT